MADRSAHEALIEMLRRELDASKSVSEHVRFLGRVAAGEAMSEGLRQQLVAHIAEEENEHQDHLARLIPALEGLIVSLGGEPEGSSEPAAEPAPSAAALPAPVVSNGFTVGSLIGKRPWHAVSPSNTGED